MNAAGELRRTRVRAGLSQSELARRAGTSQATLSAYESGKKEPSLATFARLVSAAGGRLTIERNRRAPQPRDRRLDELSGARLSDVLGLAEALPARRRPRLSYPRLDQRT